MDRGHAESRKREPVMPLYRNPYLRVIVKPDDRGGRGEKREGGEPEP